MKKIAFLMSALALVVFASCDNKENGGSDFENLIEDGWYIVGEATGFDGVSTKCMMAPGFDENNSNAAREGLYEKYIILEGGKTFHVAHYTEEAEDARYGGSLATWEVPDFEDDPTDVAMWLSELDGETMPGLTVEKTGLYYVAIDLNLDEKLKYPQILVTEVSFGVAGAMNGWGYTPMTASPIQNGKVVFTANEQIIPEGGEYKYKNGNGWKIQLDCLADVEKPVRVNTNLGADLAPGTGNIVNTNKGMYKMTLTFTQSAGEVANSWKEEISLINDLSTVPDNARIGTFDMIPVHSKVGHFWAVQYLEASEAYSFTSNLVETPFGGLSENTGATVSDNGFTVAEDGIYMIYLDYIYDSMVVEKAKVYGIGNAFNSWDANKAENLFQATAEGTELTIKAPAAGELRMYVAAPEGVNSGDWWTREFNIYEGKIEYRGGGGDLAAVPVTADQTITLNFNAGTGSIK